MRKINAILEQFEATIRLLYRAGLIAAIYLGLLHIGDSIPSVDMAGVAGSLEEISAAIDKLARAVVFK